MKVAEAITVIASTLRDGRYDALRTPRRDIDHQPWPDRIVRAGRFNHQPTAASAETRSSAPAPKNAAALPIVPAEPRTRSRRAAAAELRIRNLEFGMRVHVFERIPNSEFL